MTQSIRWFESRAIFGSLLLLAAVLRPIGLRSQATNNEPATTTAAAQTASATQTAPATTTVTVTAYRTPLSELESPATTRLLTRRTLSTAAAVTLDGQVRQIPGLELFRRSSSLVANPTSQGVSLRGLGSTSASRTLVTEDDVPQANPVGGWIQWEEQPELAIQSIELVRGGASDLYGSSAIGGVVNVIPMRPAQDQLEVRSSYGGEGTYDSSLLAEAKHGPWGVLTAGGLLGTDGFIQESPSQRGPLDVASNVHSQNALVLAEHDRDGLRLFGRTSGFNELRHNGTPFQWNKTRDVRYATGADWQAPSGASLVARIYGSSGRYRQTFSSTSNAPNTANPTCSYRCGETPTKFSYDPDNELGGALHWNQPLGAGLVLVAGADAHDVRFWDREVPYSSFATMSNLRDHQRDSAAYIEAMWVRGGWTVAASGRMDWFQNYDGLLESWNGTRFVPVPGGPSTQPSQRDERIFDPRLGITRKIAAHWAVNASGFRAFRAPTPSELYRATQVGSKLTNPNFNLLSERATGWETGVAMEWKWGTVRTSYFLTDVNRPIVAVTTCATCSPILLVRENLGEIESKGLAVDFELKPLAGINMDWINVDGGYQYAHATVSRGTQDLGNWIPEVARNMATLNVRAYKPAMGTLSLQSRLSGRQYDDDANAFMLHGYFRMDAYASHEIGKRIELFAAGENLLDRQIEVSKTPTTTLATPRTVRVGFTVRLGGGK